MSIVNPDVVRAVHEDRRRRLVREVEVQRLRRELSAARRAERPAAGRRGWFRSLTRHHDAKVTRLAASWLELDHRTARRLARVADEVELPPGTVLRPGRFGYIALDEDHRGLVVSTGTPPVTLDTAATVLILRSSDIEQIARDVPCLATVRSTAGASTPTDRTHTAERLTAEPAPIEPHGPVASAPVTTDTHHRDVPLAPFPVRPRTALPDARAPKRRRPHEQVRHPLVTAAGRDFDARRQP